MRQAVKKEARIKVPVRADIAGAFSDLAYYLDRYDIEKGLVTNISLPVMLKISAKIDDENGSMVIDLPDLQQSIEGDLDDLRKQENDNVSQIIIHFINLFDLDTAGLVIKVDGGGKIPPASGLGTSSAVGIGVIRALSELYGLHGINPCELNYIVELSMGIMGGKQDYYAAWLGGLNYLKFSGPNKSMVEVVNHYDTSSDQYRWVMDHTLIYFSGQSRSSGVANTQPEERVEKDPNILTRIAAVAADSWFAIEKMEDELLAQCIRKDRENRLELSKLYYTSKMHKMGEIAERLGYGHRACGAGSGGCMLFFGEPKKRALLETELRSIGGFRVC